MKKKIFFISLAIFILVLFIFLNSSPFKYDFKTKSTTVTLGEEPIYLNLKPLNTEERIITKPTVHVYNRQEFPKPGDNWTVRLETYFSEDLTITFNNETPFWGEAPHLKLIELRCEDNILYNPSKDISKIYYTIKQNNITFHNYACNGTTYWTTEIITCGFHRQEFLFGNSTDYAKNACSGTDTYTLRIKDPDGNDNVQTCSETITNAVSDGSPGDNCVDSSSCSKRVICQMDGTYKARITCSGCTGVNHDDVAEQDVITCAAPATNKFAIRDSGSVIKAAFDNNGYFFAAGDNYTEQSSLTPPANSFIIKETGGTVVAYIDSNGNIYLKGTVSENQASPSPPANSLIIRSSTATDVAYIDSNGNLVLKGYLYELWKDTI